MALSAEEESMETAKSAASGQKQAGRTSSEAAAVEDAQSKSTTASPWVKKKEANTIF